MSPQLILPVPCFSRMEAAIVNFEHILHLVLVFPLLILRSIIQIIQIDGHVLELWVNIIGLAKKSHFHGVNTHQISVYKIKMKTKTNCFWTISCHWSLFQIKFGNFVILFFKTTLNNHYNYDIYIPKLLVIFIFCILTSYHFIRILI